MKGLNDLRTALHAHASELFARDVQRFFKTGPGQYSAGDQFIGVRMPQIRAVAKEYKDTPLDVLVPLITSSIHEERALTLVMLVNAYKSNQGTNRDAIVAFYWSYIDHINNWDLVDISAHHILGHHFYTTKHDARRRALAKSANMWHRRIAVVSCWYDIRHHDYEAILDLAKKLRFDQEDLIHKALGWMLRDMGKRDKGLLESFLDEYGPELPRTMLRYTIERFTPNERRYYLSKK